MIIVDVNTQLLYEIEPTRQHGENPMTCPVCSKIRKKSRDRCMSWNVDEKVGRCNHCGASFVAYKPLKEQARREYTTPEWKNKTGLSDEAVKYFEGRMISQETLRRMRIYSDKEWMPQFKSEVKVMCFPYFVGSELRNIKYRGPQKSFRMVSGAELLFYNFDCIQSANELIICEGEMDALSFIDSGFPNTVSVPNGAGSTDLAYLDNYVENLNHIQKFYIAADFDEAGLKLRNELIRRLGSEKCAIVTYEGRKDANDLYRSEGGLALRRIIENAEIVPPMGGITPASRFDNIYAMFQGGLPKGCTIGLDTIDESVRWETSRLAIWTGIPNHGKSEMLDFVAMRLLLLYGWRVLYFSPENFPLEYHYAKLASKLVGQDFKEGKMTAEMFDESFDYISRSCFWLDPDDATVDGILDRAGEHIRRYGIRQLVIDPYNTLEHNLPKTANGSEYVGQFLDRLSRFARKHDILIHLVAHPTKPEPGGGPGKRTAPDLYSISGSANFYNKADYGLSVFRNYDTNRSFLFVLKVKFKNLGSAKKEGIELQYNYHNGRYGPPVGDIYLFDNSNWLSPSEDISEPFPSVSVLNNDTSFEDDEAPF